MIVITRFSLLANLKREIAAQRGPVGPASVTAFDTGPHCKRVVVGWQGGGDGLARGKAAASGFTRSVTTDAMIEKGALGFLNKPFRIEELSHQVAWHISDKT